MPYMMPTLVFWKMFTERCKEATRLRFMMRRDRSRITICDAYADFDADDDLVPNENEVLSGGA